MPSDEFLCKLLSVPSVRARVLLEAARSSVAMGATGKTDFYRADGVLFVTVGDTVVYQRPIAELFDGGYSPGVC